MKNAQVALATAFQDLPEHELVELARAGEPGAFRKIMQRYNRRLYRVARGVLGEDSEAEDVVQESYMKAFQSLTGFRGESGLSTWLTRIALNEALGRKRKRHPMVDISRSDLVDEQGEQGVLIFPGVRVGANPEADAIRAEVARHLEHAIDCLPEDFRVVFVMREIEQLSVNETASQLDILPGTVKTRLHRARRLLRETLHAKIGAVLQDTYAFDGERCARITALVLVRMGMPAFLKSERSNDHSALPLDVIAR
jgi:RNA polymerase sigma-70 factor (ECF subfamily)